MIEVNATLPATEKIRVVSLSANPSGVGSPFNKNNELWDAAYARAAKAGILVLDCTQHHGIIGACYCDPAMPDDLAAVKPGYPGRDFSATANRILAPASYRTVAEEYTKGECSRQYTGRGGLSWAIPYAAGVLALGWQVNPALTADRMVALLRETAYVNGDARIINPVGFVAAVRATTASAD